IIAIILIPQRRIQLGSFDKISFTSLLLNCSWLLFSSGIINYSIFLVLVDFSPNCSTLLLVELIVHGFLVLLFFLCLKQLFDPHFLPCLAYVLLSMMFFLS